eukprot:COSAG01_NODE_17323_length_1160_cov_0.856739_2_plen_69_part_00
MSSEQALSREQKKEESRIRRLFFELDKDGSGMIDAGEVSLLGEILLGEVMTPAQLEVRSLSSATLLSI